MTNQGVNSVIPGIRVHNPIWPSDPEHGIPLLRLDRQATVIPYPLARWGRENRRKRMTGTWHFYTDDSRFENLWSRPYHVVNSGCAAALECNFSVCDQTPNVAAMWQTYRKRWLARYWQELGVPIVVDLNVAPAHARRNLIGVPRGWRSWATRGATEDVRNDVMDEQLELAREHGEGEPALFLVYGGGRRVGDWCALRGVTWVREEQDMVPRGA